MPSRTGAAAGQRRARGPVGARSPAYAGRGRARALRGRAGSGTGSAPAERRRSAPSQRRGGRGGRGCLRRRTLSSAAADAGERTRTSKGLYAGLAASVGEGREAACCLALRAVHSLARRMAPRGRSRTFGHGLGTALGPAWSREVAQEKASGPGCAARQGGSRPAPRTPADSSLLDGRLGQSSSS